MSEKRALDLLIDEHERIGSPLRQYLRPGLDTQRIDATMRSLDVGAPRAIGELWAAHDGVDHRRADDDQRGGLFPAGNLSWFSFDRTAREYELNLAQSTQSCGFLGQETWKREWFPTFSIGGARWVAADLSTDEELILVSFQDELVEPARTGMQLDGFPLALVEQFRSGAYRWVEPPQGFGLEYVDDLGVPLPGQD